jgi:hypothetical protein
MDTPKLQLSVQEVSRMLSASGCALIGCPSKVWEDEKVLAQLQALDDDKYLELLMMQQIGIRPADEMGQDYTMCLFRALT